MDTLYIWGRGEDATRLLEASSLYIPLITGVIDSAKGDKQDDFYGIPIYTKEEINWNDEVYVIVATRKYYEEISLFLTQQGKKYLDDYCDFHYAWNKWRGTFKHRAYSKRINLFLDKVSELNPWIDDVIGKVKNNPATYTRYILSGDISVEKAVLACCVNDSSRTIELRDAILEYDSLDDLTIIFFEILIHEDYYFDSNNPTPLILDCGANIGLAVYYFKHLYPESNIIAFEPNPVIMDILRRNIVRNRWNNIELHQAALHDSAHKMLTFYAQKSGIAGSLEKRNLEGITGDVEEISVETDCLRDYISGDVDYLKIDVEGSETKVIKSLGDKLKLVKHIFIEFHEGRLKGDNSISYILTELENNSFSVIVSRSLSSMRYMSNKTMRSVGGRVSEVIWGKRNGI